ncbi:hypothetical protein LSH36_1915g00000 [Paralvinella palmiformis]|uniref:Uncharacterized protein n=1 Tax=Paralvinella palmiformis TaxID=53620 RepID=A0AAD9MQI7_9ANNE|nr:hypothetical protein LSH36_1915g00000 [Paralvinella palmiformis]
MHSAGDLVAL